MSQSDQAVYVVFYILKDTAGIVFQRKRVAERLGTWQSIVVGEVIVGKAQLHHPLYARNTSKKKIMSLLPQKVGNFNVKQYYS